MYYCYFDSPIGDLLLAGDDAAVRLLGFAEGRMRRAPEDNWQRSERPFRSALKQLGEYFDGVRSEFDLDLAPAGTAFQRSVYEALQDIPYGATITYAELARRVGRPKAVRAVGAANGRNPIPIFIPCHRVIGSDGSLTGFGGGLPTKRALLRLESEHGAFELTATEA